MSGYPPEVWRRFAAPAYAGGLADADVRCGQAGTPGADAELELDLRLDADRIAAAAFRVHGCPSTVAAADWLCERIIGCAPAEAAAVTAADVEAALGLAPEKRFCGLLAVDALAAALAAEAEDRV